MNRETSHLQDKFQKQAAVIGNPITHSKSPLIHNHFIRKYNINAIYTPIKIITESDLISIISTIRHPNWVGINVTIPHKEKIIDYLDSVDDNVEIIGACNTIINQNGTLHGANTDAEGFYFPLMDKTFNTVTILGNGGAAKAVLYQCAKIKIPNINIIARNHSKSDQLVKRLTDKFNTSFKFRSFEDKNSDIIESSELIVNTTNVGMNAHDQPFEFIGLINHKQIFYDLIYSPWKTQMMLICESNGARVLNGAPMLAHQGALAFEKFFNQSADTIEMLKLIEEAMIR